MRLFQQTKHALGSTALLTVVTETDSQAEEIMEQLWEMIDEFEARFSRFKLDSELTYFNQHAGKFVPITAHFHGLLIAARNIGEETEGLYNPFILPALQRAGYVGSWPNPIQADKQLNFANRRVHSIDTLQVKKTSARIPATAALDFGGIGKGYLLDRLADLAAPACKGFWFSLGGDIICEGYNITGKVWTIYIQAAEHQDTSIGSVENVAGERMAVATSGVTKRRGTQDDNNWHHIIDPRTGQSAITDILTASVRAKRATEADVYTSCVVILGSLEGSSFLKQHQLSGLLQLQQNTEYSENVRSIGLNFTLRTPSKGS